jgi:hypothetical protein
MAIRLGAKIAAQHATKEAVRREAGEGWGLIASLGVSVLTSVTEQADERCWMTLPRNLQFLRAYLPEGEHEATISIQGGSSQTIRCKITVKPSKITFINVRTMGHRVFWHSSQQATGKESGL